MISRGINPFPANPDPFMAVVSEPERSLPQSRPGTACETLPQRVDEVLDVEPAADTALSSAPRFSLLAMIVAPFVALVRELVRLDVASFTGTEHEICRECERPCANVNSDVITAEPCSGRVHIGQCTVCPDTVRVVRVGSTWRCAGKRLHAVVSVRPKPYEILSITDDDCPTCVAYDAALRGRFDEHR